MPSFLHTALHPSQQALGVVQGQNIQRHHVALRKRLVDQCQLGLV